MIKFKIFKYEDNSELIKFYKYDFLVNEMYIVNNEFLHCNSKCASMKIIRNLKKVKIAIKDKFVSIKWFNRKKIGVPVDTGGFLRK